MSDLRSVVADHWAALGAAPASESWLTSALPVSAGGAPLLCAIGPDRRRHLLVPVENGATIRPDSRAAAVHLGSQLLQADTVARPYADLVLLRDDLADIFTGLCADIVMALAVDTSDPVTVVAQVLDGWYELFRSGRQLGVEQLAGLFGELIVVNRLLDVDVDVLKAWRGPLREPHDFQANGWAVEVKSTASSEGRTVRIHGIDQLDAGPGSGLMLLWMRFDTTGTGGTTLPDLVDATADRIPRPREWWQLLARAGYLAADRERYDGLRFTLVEEAAFRVTSAFPRIIAASFPQGAPRGVANLRYTVDLEVAPPPMLKEEIADFMSAMTQR